MDKEHFEEVVSRLKAVTGSKSDTALALKLGMKREALASRRMRDSLPYREIIQYADKAGLSLDFVFRGTAGR